MRYCRKCKTELTELELWAEYERCSNCIQMDLWCEVCGTVVVGTGWELDGRLHCKKCFEDYENA